MSKQLPPKGREDPREVIRQYCVVWGTATTDATDTLKDRRDIRFRVKYGEEPNPQHEEGKKNTKNKYMTCRASGDQEVSAIMAAIKRKEIVVCFGRVTTKKRQQGDGYSYEMHVHIAIPLAMISFLFRLYESDAIRKLLEKDENAEADSWDGD